MANAISTHRPSQEDYDMLDALEKALNEIDSALVEDRDLEEVLLSIEEEIGYSIRNRVESVKSLARRYNARILISDRELESIIEAEKGRGWLFRVANRVDVEHNGQRKRLLDVIREQAIKAKKTKKSRKVAEEVENMYSIEKKVKSPSEAVERAKELAEKYGARLLTSEEEIKNLFSEYGWKEAKKHIKVEYKGKEISLSSLPNKKSGEKRKGSKIKLTEAQKEERRERVKRKLLVKPGRGQPWYQYTFEGKLDEKGKIKLTNKDKKVLGRIFYEVIDELYPYAASSATITRMLSSGAGAKLAITNFPRLYSSKRAFSDTLKALTEDGVFNNKENGWKVLSVIFRVRSYEVEENGKKVKVPVQSKAELVEALRQKLEKTAEKLSKERKIVVNVPDINEKQSVSDIYRKVKEFYSDIYNELVKKGKLVKPKKEEYKNTEAYKGLTKHFEKRKSLLQKPPGEEKGRRIEIVSGTRRKAKAVAEEIEEFEDIEEEIAEYEREVGAEFLEVSQPVTFTQNLVNGLVIGFVSIGTLWATSKISDFIAGWVSKWLKADEKYIKAIGDIGAGILILNSPRIWRAFMKDEMPVQGKVAALVVGWGSIANGITLAIRNERLIKVSEMVDNAIEGIGRFITNAITQKPEGNDTSKLQNITQTADDWKVSTSENIDTSTEEIYGLDLLPTRADTTDADTEYVEYNFEIEN